MANAQTKHSIALRRETAKKHNEKINTQGERLNGGLFGTDADTIRELAQVHGNKMDAVRFLIQFYNDHK